MKLYFFLIISTLFGVAAVKAEPVNWDLARKLTQSGTALYKQGQYQKALKEFLLAYQITKHPKRLQNIAKCYEKLLNYKEAIYYLTEYTLQRDEKRVAINNHLFSMLPFYLRGKEALRLKTISRWLDRIERQKLAAVLPVVYSISALTYILREKLDIGTSYFWGAIRDLKKHGLKEPTVKYLLKQGLEKLRAGQLPLAQKYFFLAIELGPEKTVEEVGTQYFEKGDQYRAQKKYALALSLYNQALRLSLSASLKGKIQLQVDFIEAVFKKEKQRIEQAAQKKKALLAFAQRTEKKQRQYKIAGWTLIGTGSALIITSVVLGIFTKQTGDSADSKWSQYNDERGTDSAAQQRRNEYYADFEAYRKKYDYFLGSAIITGCAGLVAIGIGITLIALSRKHTKTIAYIQEHISIRPVFDSKNNFDGGVVEFRF